jgi:hypothetical protein
MIIDSSPFRDFTLHALIKVKPGSTHPRAQPVSALTDEAALKLSTGHVFTSEL